MFRLHQKWFVVSRRIVTRRVKSTFTHVYLDDYRLKETFRTFQVRTGDDIDQLKDNIAKKFRSRHLDPIMLEVFSSKDEMKRLPVDARIDVRGRDNPLYVTWQLTDEEKDALGRAENFLNAVLNAQYETLAVPEDILEKWDECSQLAVTSKWDDPRGIQILKNIPSLDGGTAEDIVIRECIDRIWDLALREVKSIPLKAAVAIVGNPGIGKSFSIRYGVKKILETGNSVTVLTRTLHQIGWYYQFVPDATNGSVTCRVFPESDPVSKIPEMDDPDAYLIVDPGKTKTSCDWVEDIAGKLIIVPSPDSGHWGHNEFTKTRTDTKVDEGRFIYVPPYSLSQLLTVVPYLQGEQAFSQEEIAERYYYLGGNLRRVLYASHALDDIKAMIHDEVQSFSTDLATGIARGVHRVDFKADMPSSLIVGISASEDLRRRYTVVQSRYANHWIAKHAGDNLWDAATSNDRDGGTLMESFATLKLSTETLVYISRNCVGKKDTAYNDIKEVVLGAAVADVRAVRDPAISINAEELAQAEITPLFTSTYAWHPLFDMIYRRGKVFYAFNVTKQKRKHVAKNFATLVEELAQKLLLKENKRELRLYYATSSSEFDEFVTDPVKPTANCKGVQVFHLHLVRNPKGAMVTQ